MDARFSARSIVPWILALALSLAMIPTTALAQTVLNLGHGTPSAGSTLKITWNKMDDADHYEVSVRNLTTDELIYDHEYTTSRSFKIKGKYLLEENSYRVWVGAYRPEDTGFPPATHTAQWEFTVPGDTCYHTNGTYDDIIKKVYLSISNTEHKATTTLNRRCRDCDEALEKNVVVEEVDPHFLDDNGDCKLCNYTASCSHTNVKPQVEKESYSYKDEETHLYVETGHYVCQNASCSKVIKPYYNETEEKHTFKSNKCKYCGYVRAEKLSVTVARAQSSAKTGEGISATATATGGSGSYSYAWEVICDGSVVDRTAYASHNSYSYVPDKAGKWKFKVYLKDKSTQEELTATSGTITVTEAACSHSSTRKETTDTQYIKASDTKHEIKTIYRVYCVDCGETISKNNYTIETVSHTLDASGRCVCGYVKPTASCSHSSKTTEQVGQPRIEQYDNRWHKVIYTYKDICANKSCQVVLNARREETKLVVHSFNAKGQCECGYNQPTAQCDHAPTKTVRNSKYIAVDGQQHHYIVTYHYECDCGKVNYDEDAQSFDPHAFSGNKCRLCGYTKTETPTCDHKTTKTKLSSKVVDDKNSDTTHFVVTTYREQCACGQIDRTVEEKQTVPCTFVKNAGVQAEHEAQGHQYFDRCECTNAKVNGRYTAYLSTCSVCAQGTQDGSLKRGMRGDRVKELQRMLGLQNVDGIFGGETEAAVEEFQRSHGLTVTGVVDDATWEAIKNSQGASTPQEPQTPQDTSTSQDDTATNVPEDTSKADSESDKEIKDALDVSEIATPVLDITINGALNPSADTDVLEFVHNPSSAFQSDSRQTLLYAKQIVMSMLEEKRASASDELLNNVQSYGTSVGMLDEVCGKLGELYKHLGKTSIASNAKDFEDMSKAFGDASKGFEYGGAVIEGVVFFLEAYQIDNELEANREQLKAIVEDAYEYEVSMRLLDRLIASTSGDLRDACVDARTDLQAAFENNYATLSRYAESVNKKSSLVFDTAMGITIVPLGAYSLLSLGVDGMIDAQKRLVNVDSFSDSAYASLKTAVATGDESAVALFDLYCNIQMAGYDAASDYYSAYAKTLRGGWNEFWGRTNKDSVLQAIEDERTQFKNDAESIRRNLTE